MPSRSALFLVSEPQMTLYEICRKYYKRIFVALSLFSHVQKPTDETSLVMSVSSGYLSSGIAAFVTTPMDVVKTRMMLSAAERNPETSVIHMFRKIYRVSFCGTVECRTKDYGGSILALSLG